MNGIYCLLPTLLPLGYHSEAWWVPIAGLGSQQWNFWSTMLLGCMHLRDVFRFSTQQCNDMLLFWTPRYHSTSQVKSVSWYWVPVFLACPVGITETFNKPLTGTSKGKTVVFSGVEVADNVFYPFPVNRSQILHELWQYTNRICDIRSWYDSWP